MNAYAAAFRNPDGTISRQRFLSYWQDSNEVRNDIIRQWGVVPCEISCGWTGEILWREKQEAA